MRSVFPAEPSRAVADRCQATKAGMHAVSMDTGQGIVLLLVSIKGPLLLVATEARLTRSWTSWTETVLGRHESTRLAYAAYAGSAGFCPHV